MTNSHNLGLNIKKIHHLAIICSDYAISKDFYVNKLGLKIVKETFREERNSFKLDLAIGEHYVIELFSFPSPPQRCSQPEAAGLRHLAFEVANIEESVAELHKLGVNCEAIRIDPNTGKKFTFFADPDNLPLELYEM